MVRRKLGFSKKFVIFLTILSLVGSFVVPTEKVEASFTTRCAGYSVLNTPGCDGYNNNTSYYSTTAGITGQNILYNTSNRSDWAIPSSVNTNAEFKTYIKNFLGTSTAYNYNRAGAAFVVNTMLGEDGNCSGNFCGTTASIAYAQAHIADWEAKVDAATINWNYSTSLKAGDINSIHVCTKGTTPANCTLNGIIAGTHDAKDFSFFKMTSADGTEVSHEIRFYDKNGALQYRLRRECGNLIGWTDGLPDPANYNLKPTINATVKDGGTTVPGNVAEVGNTVTFNYAIINSGDASDSVDCTVYANTHNGYYQIVSPPEHGTVKSKAGCPRTFPARTTTQLTTANETITIGNADVNKTICRTLYVNPYKPAAGERGVEVCIIVAAKPYVKVLGGDVSAGNGISSGANSTTCSPNATGSIVSWNRGSSAFLGAGTQFAAMALGTIDEFASAQQNVNGASANDGLTFSNTVPNGTYGGDFGTLPCIPDYYSKAANTTAVGNTVNASTLATGAYSASGTVTINGGDIVNPGNRSVLYVDGDAYITSNIRYAGSWSYDKVPLFELVVKGNIYIAPGVTQLDGAYIAQPDGGSKGNIYTCATSTGPYDLDGSLYNRCKTKLTVNGLFSGEQIYLMRTYGTLSQAAAVETAIGSFAGEVFNYNPTLWIAQPPAGTASGSSKIGDYDAITSLPPVL